MKPILTFVFSIYNNRRLLLVLIFLLSLVVSLFFLFFLRNIGPVEHQVPGTDYLYCYAPMARNILQWESLVWPDKTGVCAAPGYPIILAGIFSFSQLLGGIVDELVLIIIFNILITAGVVSLLFLIAEYIFNKRIALMASLLWLSYPFNLWFLKNPHTEVPFIFFLFLGIWLFLSALREKRIGLIFLAGLIFGLATLIRPIGLLLSPFLVIFLFFLIKEERIRRKILLATFFLIGTLIVLLPWEFYLLAETGQFIPLASGGPATIVEGLTFGLGAGAAGDRVIVPNDVLALMKRAKSEDLSSNWQILQLSLQELKTEPIAFLKLMGLKITRAWYATSQRWWEGRILLVQLLYLLPAFGGIVYGLKTYRQRTREIIFLLSFVLYFWLMAIIAISILRYMVPAMGLLLIFSAIFFAALTERLVKTRNTFSL